MNCRTTAKEKNRRTAAYIHARTAAVLRNQGRRFFENEIAGDVKVALFTQPWSYNACRGYIIDTMENYKSSPTDIRRVLTEFLEHLRLQIAGRSPSGTFFWKREKA